MIITKTKNEELVNNVMTNFISPLIDKKRQDNPEIEMFEKTSIRKLREHLDKFIKTLGFIEQFRGKWYFRNEMSHGTLSKDTNIVDTTAIWAINLMRELNLKTIPMKNSKKFEKNLTEYIKQQSI